jgi:hypothetical protein
MCIPVLLKIARCNELPIARADPKHPCHGVAVVQPPENPDDWQVPEPWRGDLANAPLLFVSSNPSLGKDDCPWHSESDLVITRYYGRNVISTHFPKWTSRAGVPSTRGVPFWQSIHARAVELYELCNINKTDVIPGLDYAITEVVHCKSIKEIGVPQARQLCATKYLAAILSASGAKVIVVFGNHAAAVLKPNISAIGHMTGPAPIIVGLPHPNARTPRTVAACLTSAQQAVITKALYSNGALKARGNRKYQVAQNPRQGF